MTLLMLDIPDSPEAMGGWLERQLVGGELGELVAQLAAVHGKPAGPLPSLNRALGTQLHRVLDQGCGVLGQAEIRELLQRPHLLLELQEEVLARGGPYWESVASAPESFHGAIERGRRRVETLLRPPGSRWSVPRRGLAAAAMAAAAGLLVWVSWPAWRRADGTPDGAVASAAWGWNRAEALRPGLAREAYLERLADSAGEWFQRKPGDALGLARQLNEFRAGCSRLILEEHPSLTDVDRDWLRTKCRQWADKLSGHLADLEAGSSARRIRADADRTVSALMRALRGRVNDHSPITGHAAHAGPTGRRLSLAPARRRDSLPG